MQLITFWAELHFLILFYSCLLYCLIYTNEQLTNVVNSIIVSILLGG